MVEELLTHAFAKIPASAETKSLVKSYFSSLNQNIFRKIKQTLKKAKKKLPKKQDLPTKQESHQSKEEKFQELRQKEEDTREFVKKIQKDRLKREKRQKERIKEENLRVQEEQRALEKQKQDLFQKTEEEKMQKLKKMQEKSWKRKQEVHDLIELGHQEYKKVVSSTPLHEKIQKNYLSTVLMPELERHKIELAKKREIFQPINRSVIIEHAKRHDQLIEDHISKRNHSQDPVYDPSKFRSKFTLAYIEDQKKRKTDQGKEKIEKKALSDKRKQYSELVLEMYQPTIDHAKQLELSLIKEKLNQVGFVKRVMSKSLSANGEINESEKIVKKWRKKIEPPPPAKKDPVVIDWLSEKRKIRESQKSRENYREDFSEGASKDEILRRVKSIEKEVKRREVKLKGSLLADLSGVKESVDLGEMMVASIKGKLAMLDH